MGLESIINFFGSNWDKLVHYLNDDFHNTTSDEKMRFASEVRTISAVASATVTVQPIPFADIWIITPIQYAMVRAIGNIYGYKISESSIGEVLAVIGGGVTGQQICLSLYKLGMPGLGGLFGASFVFAWTHGIGQAAEAYFRSGMTKTREELDKIRKQGEARAREDWDRRRGNL